ncbi:MAG: hypothetical protein JXR86_07320 [Spirochaetales bacterium]|nr:hypothetical protein [Spirochaetales bacterium]
MTWDRPYKKAYPHEQAREIIISQAGKHFDPLIVDVFLHKEEDFIRLNSLAQSRESVYS